MKRDMKICIIGLPKSGTSALYKSVKNALDDSAITVFEPRVADELNYLLSSPGDALCKVMFGKIDVLGYHPDKFDKNVAIIRDPRDLIVSMLLYRFDSSAVVENAERFRQILELLEKKEGNPRAVSIISILEGFGKNEQFRFFHALCSMLENYSDFLSRHKGAGIAVIKYEEYFGGNVKELSEYLGLNLVSSVTLSGWIEKIQRKGTSGDWKNWFTEEDVEFFKPAVAAWMRKWRYGDDWSLADNPEIEKQHCSGYVQRLVRSSEIDPLKGGNDTSPDQLLESAARDGKKLAMFKWANRLIDRGGVNNIEAALEWYKRAGMLGHAESAFRAGKYYAGAGDHGEAVKQFNVAYEHGHAGACYYLWAAFKDGLGVNRDGEKASEFLRTGAERGSKSCERRLVVGSNNK